MVGSEGTLGVITKIILKVTPLPEATASAMAIFDKLEQAALCVSEIISIPLIPSQLELMDSICIKAVNKASKMGLPEVEAILLIGVDGSLETVKNDIEKVIKICQETGAKEVKFTQKKEEEAKIWAARKAMIPSLSRYIEDKVCVSLADDMAVPMSKIPDVVKVFHQIAKKYDLLIPVYGHAGDGNLHTKFILDSTSKEEWQKAEKAVEEMYEAVFAFGGTTTGEHGSGITKAPLMQKERKDSLNIMKSIKKALDPNNIMNPNKMMDWQGSFITDLRYKEIALDKKESCLSKWKKEMDTCTYCGFCKSVCPIFENTYWDTETARGKILNAYGLLTGELTANENIAKIFYSCTQCKDCYRRCPSKIKVPEIIQEARTYLIKQGIISPIHKTLIENIENTKNIFGDKELNFPQQEGEILLFIGCQYLSRTNKTKMYIKILEKLGIKVKIKKEICCGFSMKNLGFEENFEKHKQQFSSMIEDENIITFCPTCTLFLKEEYKLNPKHILEVILEKISNKNDSKPKVTYHDPCDFSRGLSLIEEPRKIIKKLGYDLVEMEYSKNTSRCCGGGGGMLVSEPLLVEKISQNRIKQALKTGANFLITSCPTCEQVLKNAASKVTQEGKGNIEVVDIREILWKEIK
ncbi:MAG: FAD-linked oxidase C-terminal domain-containing protein [bacterium]